MSRADIEKHRQQSRAKDSMMWSKFYEEAAKKTVLRRCAKAAPQAAEFEALMARDEEPAMMPVGEMAELPQPEPEPQPPPRIEHEKEPERDFVVTDLEGEEKHFATTTAASHAIVAVLEWAAKQGLQRLEGAWESNQATVDEIGKVDRQDCANLYTIRDGLRDGVRAAAAETTFPGDLPEGQTLDQPELPALAAISSSRPSATANRIGGPGRSRCSCRGCVSRRTARCCPSSLGTTTKT